MLKMNKNHPLRAFNNFPMSPIRGDKLPFKLLSKNDSWKNYQGKKHPNQKSPSFGIPCGPKNSNLYVIDIDAKEGRNPLEIFANLSDNFSFGKTPVYTTPGGGVHIYLYLRGFKKKDFPHNTAYALVPRKDNPERSYAIIESRGADGFVKAGKGYKLMQGTTERILILDPSHFTELEAICRSFNEFEPKIKEFTPEAAKRGEYQGESPGSLFNSAPEGYQYIVDYLKAKGWKLTSASRGTWRRPGKKEGNSAQLNTNLGVPIFYNYSSSISEFPLNEGITPFYFRCYAENGGVSSSIASQVAKDIRSQNKSWFPERVERTIEDAEIIEEHKEKNLDKKSKKSALRNINNYYFINDSVYFRDEIGVIEKMSFQSMKLIFGKDWFSLIPKKQNHLSGFRLMPSHTDYKIVNDFKYNLYKTPPKIKVKKKDFPTIKAYLKRVFGKKYKHILDYFYMVYFKPKQRLPIVCLVSEKQETGKTQIAELLRLMIGEENVKDVNVSDFFGRFTDSYATAGVVVLDEANVLPKDMGTMKKLATSKEIKYEKKGGAAKMLPNFQKYIILSNDETTVINATGEDKRFWIFKVPKIKKADYLEDFQINLAKEVGAFIKFLKNRKLTNKKSKGRFYFSDKVMRTKQLKKVISESVNPEFEVMAESFKEYLEKKDLKEDENAYTILTDVKEIVNREFKNNFTPFDVRKFLTQGLKKETKFKREVPLPTPTNALYDRAKPGRYYEISIRDLNKFLGIKETDLETIDEDETPPF